ncbi:peroxiredoxin [Spongisporangium articulatum]|uniref:thioredoxin-dependent peroxiredoxin n=1 Tax=Spongisporangium articulatum TaxID=3362603 RepID=A0ABW8ALN8_9ACTN
MSLEIGQPAPDFSLRDEHGQTITLSEVRREKPVAVVFYPFAFSGICTGELCELRDNIEAFESAGVQVLAVSTDAVPTLRAWADQQKYPFPLLSDFWPHGATSQAYGVFNDAVGCAIRGSFLIDTEGVLRWAVVNEIGEARPLAEYKEALAAL